MLPCEWSGVNMVSLFYISKSIYYLPIVTATDVSIKVYLDELKHIKGLLLQDKQMKEAFNAYPEFLCLDVPNNYLILGYQYIWCYVKILTGSVILLLFVW